MPELVSSFTPPLVLDAYGSWIASLAPWTHFVTPTHRPPDEQIVIERRRRQGKPINVTVVRPGYSRVGVAHSRRAVHDWFHRIVRSQYPAAQWWSEMELHKSGQPHHHALLALPRHAAWIKLAVAWRTMGEGYMRIEPIENDRDVAAYCAKYSVKSAAWPPLIYGIADASLDPPGGLSRTAQVAEPIVPIGASRGPAPAP